MHLFQMTSQWIFKHKEVLPFESCKPSTCLGNCTVCPYNLILEDTMYSDDDAMERAFLGRANRCIKYADPNDAFSIFLQGILKSNTSQFN